MENGEIIPKRYASLIGLGVMFMWASAIVAWSGLWTSDNLIAKTLGLLGACLVSVSGIAIFLYTSSLEERLNKQNSEQ
jgi:hypothetical protein